ncbi:hypothetical protein D9757_010038 [Collybiopsis confluens]|uniref:Uncharacterized protein n=1 Tax=Collybiopsis confluens TaxID=2823264 RepID=A0A8H5LTA0_9AGAR|nr:hypothetical protein D9757_010038 [Collybiopsis confluens]
MFLLRPRSRRLLYHFPRSISFSRPRLSDSHRVTDPRLPEHAEHAVISTFDLFSIGVGPSSSHTVGPMRAGRIFISDLKELNLLEKVATVKITLYGSLAATGKGHHTPQAILLGLEGSDPETIIPTTIESRYQNILNNKTISLGGQYLIKYDMDKDMLWRWDQVLPTHPNGMRFSAFDGDGTLLATNEYYSVGGGFVVNEKTKVDENLFYKGVDKSAVPPARLHQSHSLTEPAYFSPSIADSASAPETSDTDSPVVAQLENTGPPYPFESGNSLLALTRKHNMTIAQIVYDNEKSFGYSDEDIHDKISNIWSVMDECIQTGVTSSVPTLPGRLGLRRRAPILYRRLMRGFYPGISALNANIARIESGDVEREALSLAAPQSTHEQRINTYEKNESGASLWRARSVNSPSAKRAARVTGAFDHPLLPEAPRKTMIPAMDFLSCYAIAVNEVNASGGRIVTSPTNGAAGVIPAVLKYIIEFISDDPEKSVMTFLLTASAIGMLFKRASTISAAEGGCQAEVGVACSMAAAGFAACMGASPETVLQAAEIGIEHNLGLTCDPIDGLVQVPCIERNSLGAVKAITAAQLSLASDGVYSVTLDEAIEAMRLTAADMSVKYKETSLSGLATSVKIPLSVPACLSPSKVFSNSIPSRLLPNLLLSNTFFVAALLAGKEWIFEYEVGVFWLTMRVLACGGVGVIGWEALTGQLSRKRAVEWPVLGIASLSTFVQQGCLLTALFRLSPIRVLLFTQFSPVWLDALMNFAETRKMNAIICAFILGLLSDANFSSSAAWSVLPGYLAIIGHAIASSVIEHTYGVLSPGLSIPVTIAATTLGASLFALPFYVFRTVLLGFPTAPVLPLFALPLIPFMAYSLLYLSPTTGRFLKNASPTPRHLTLSFPYSFGCAAVLGLLAFSQTPSWTDAAIGILLYFGMLPPTTADMPIAPRTPTSRLIRSYLKTILSNPESRKIFYFLLLNMCYMLVQMLYGVWTNSLGLISDAIHMAFDCMAIGVGLFASVMATWEPNETFTYGYGRIETLSGFANGIFLILISIFIVFEAVQRILDPPEMDTSQLLLVSSLGLAVNLFGMFAMGGHHHHGGHSHSHGHSHSGEGHGHSHSTSPLNPVIHSHSHSPPHAEHSRSHLHEPSSPTLPDSSHSHSLDEPHSHASNGQAHSHDVENNSDSSSYTHSHNHSGHDHYDHRHSRSRSHADSTDPEKQSKRQFLGPTLHLNDERIPESPITPSYSFTHDEHYKIHHAEAPAPNLHDHSHAPSHEGHSHNMRGVFLHVMADTLGSVGVIISTLLIQFYGWTGFDPIASLFIAVLIAASVIPLVVDTGKVLALDIDSKALKIEEALAELKSIEGLASYSCPRFWPKDANSLIGSIHVQLAPSAASVDPHGPHSTVKTTFTKLDRVVERVDRLLRQKIRGLEELTIQVEEGHV